MGRRSINTTKSGKYMNPTDQARKEARKKELKKNKKQRQMVRAAVLKGKDPMQIIEEMEKIDQMEYNVLQPSPLNEKVLKDKRKKLRDTLDRVLKMYNKDDPDKWIELKRSQAEYERRRGQLISFYESVKHAQSVSVDEIPLPAIQVPEHISSMFANAPSQIPLPASEASTNNTASKPLGILKRTAGYGLSADKDSPGVPACPPAELPSCSESEDEAPVEPRTKTLRFSDEIQSDDDKSDDEESIKPTSLQQRMVALSGQNIDEFMKEMEAVHKKQEDKSDEEKTEIIPPPQLEKPTIPQLLQDVAPPGTDPKERPLQLPPNPGLPVFRPPPPMRPVLPLMAMRLPPGPPPGRPNLPPGPPPGIPPPRLGLRLPPGPPPGIPPRLIRLQLHPGANPNVLSAGPQLINRSDGKQSATIMAKPQIRNLSADVTRFVPSALRVKREDKKAKNVAKAMLVQELKQQEMMVKPTNTATKDDAYMQFMKEMEGLL